MGQDAVVLKTRDTGKGAARACRREGLVPGVIYGKAFDPVPVSLTQSDVKDLMSGGHIHKVTVEGSSIDGNVMVKDASYDPVTGRLVHIDLHRISMTEKVRTEIAVNVIGEEELEKQGLVLQRQLISLPVECLPGDIPDAITLDVSGLEAGETVTAGDLPVPDGVRSLTSPEEVVVVVLTPRAVAEEEEEEDEAEEGKEPEEKAQVPEQGPGDSA